MELNSNLFYQLTFGVVEKLSQFMSSAIALLEKEIRIPLYVAILGNGNTQWITITGWNLLGGTLVTIFLGRLILKMLPIL